jgi:hypothetical protein
MARTMFIALLIAALFIPACIKPVIFTPTADEPTFAATKPEDVSFTTLATVDGPYKEVGYVFAQGQNWSEALKIAKEKTAAIGGDAIIQGRGSTQVVLAGLILFFPMYETYYFAEGRVIRYE